MESQLTHQSSGASSITLRPVGPDDEALLLALYASTRAAEMAMVPWSDEQREAFVKMQFAGQQAHYQKTYPAASHQIMVSDDRPIGRLYVARLADQIRIIDITVMPLERNRGIGTLVLKELMAEGAQTGKGVTIYVENYSPSLSLFERLNFKRIEQQGFHLLLQWSKSPG